MVFLVPWCLGGKVYGFVGPEHTRHHTKLFKPLKISAFFGVLGVLVVKACFCGSSILSHYCRPGGKAQVVMESCLPFQVNFGSGGSSCLTGSTVSTIIS
jgi:hypothetical protein